MKCKVITILCLIATTIAIIITQMCFIKTKDSEDEHEQFDKINNNTTINGTNGYGFINDDNGANNSNITDNKLNGINKSNNGMVSAIYYSNWSPYEPKYHFPHDIDLSGLTHIYYAFFVVDGKTGSLKSSDEWSDIQMDVTTEHDNNFRNTYNKVNFLKGCIGELYELKQNNNFKVVMSVGGWSNRDAFPQIAKDPRKLQRFMDSCVETMFKFGFDGIDLDWEFPREGTDENLIMLQMVKGIRERLNQIEFEIWGQSKGQFQLSVAAPAFREKLQVLLVNKMNKYLTYWNMMTYDYFGDWSKVTGYHSQLYCDDKMHDENKNQIYAQYKHTPSGHSDQLCGDNAIRYMLNEGQIPTSKIIFGMAMYGRGFKNIKFKTARKNRPIDNKYINKPFNGVCGFDPEEPGMWMYNQLPLKNTVEQFDPQRISAFCFDSKTNAMVGYDNKNTVKKKTQYIKEKGLGGAFWWESCGNKWDDPTLSLTNVFHNEVNQLVEAKSVFKDPLVWQCYLKKWGNSGFLSKYIAIQQQNYLKSNQQEL